MFQIANAANEAFWAVVRVEIPGDNGHKKTHTFKAKYKRLDQDELDELNRRVKAGEVTDAQLLDEVMVGWADVKDQDNNDLPFNAENLAALLRIHPTRPTLAQTFFDTTYGNTRKN